MLVFCKEYKKENKPLPEPEELLKAPRELKSCEELYLAGEHLEPYRHATFEPAEYYLEGLKRDPTDIRLNNAYGLYLYKNGRVKESIDYFRRAIEKQTWKTPILIAERFISISASRWKRRSGTKRHTTLSTKPCGATRRAARAAIIWLESKRFGGNIPTLWSSRISRSSATGTI